MNHPFLDVYTMKVQQFGDPEPKQHPYHLGTRYEIAEAFIFGELQKPATAAVQLFLGATHVATYPNEVTK